MAKTKKKPVDVQTEDADSWAVKYRPRNLDDIVGQPQAIAAIKGAIKRNDLPRSLLISGMRGTGKTTLARLYARLINNVPEDKPLGLDVQEINSAQERGIDDIRKLTESLRFMPTEYKYKVIIGDEMQQLTSQAMTALLKPLEEPPKHVVMILATNEPHKLPQTIVDRCIHFQLEIVQPEMLMPVLKRICKKERVFLPTDDKKHRRILRKIAEASDGNPRNAITLLYKAASIAAADDEPNLDRVLELVTNPTDKVSVILTALVYAAAAPKANRSELFGVAVKQIASTKEYSSLIRGMLDLNTFLIEKNNSVWTYPSTARTSLSNVWKSKGLSFDAKTAVIYHDRLTNLLARTMYAGANEKALVISTIGQQILGVSDVRQ